MLARCTAATDLYGALIQGFLKAKHWAGLRVSLFPGKTCRDFWQEKRELLKHKSHSGTELASAEQNKNGLFQIHEIGVTGAQPLWGI